MPNSNAFTLEEINQILEQLNAHPGARLQYIGSRYVPIFGRKGEDSIEWDNSGTYEPLTIVLYQGNSYTSRQFVPVGIEITNEEYWAKTGNYNAQIEQYRQEVTSISNEVAAVEERVDFVEYFADGINVCKYGAKGDGVTNCTDAFLSAISAYYEASDPVFGKSQKIVKFYIPNGVYVINSDLVFDAKGTTTSSESRTCGIAIYGNGATLLMNGHKVAFNGGNVLMRDIIIANPSTGVDFATKYSPYCELDNVTVINATENGISFNGTYVTSLKNCNVWNSGNEAFSVHGGTSVTLIGCYANRAATGYFLSGLGYSNLISCACDTVETAYYIYNSDLNLSGCGCEKVTNYGVHITGPSYIPVITNFYVNNCGTAVIYNEANNAIPVNNVQYSNLQEGCKLFTSPNPKSYLTNRYKGNLTRYLLYPTTLEELGSAINADNEITYGTAYRLAKIPLCDFPANAMIEFNLFVDDDLTKRVSAIVSCSNSVANTVWTMDDSITFTNEKGKLVANQSTTKDGKWNVRLLSGVIS